MSVLSFKRKEIQMWCDEAGQPVILEDVSWSDLGLRERKKGEPVHYRENQEDECIFCGAYGGVWIENESSFNIHPEACFYSTEGIPPFLKRMS